MLTRRFRICRLLGFNIYIDLSWFLIAILITWSLATSLFPSMYPDLSNTAYWWMGVAGALGLFASILLHELGHSVVAQRFGVEMKGITLFIFGGVAEMSSEPPSAKAEFWVAIAGPVVSVVLAIAFYGASLASGSWLPVPVAAVIWYLGLINAVVVGFNLIPAFPLDGGRVLRSILWAVKGSLRQATQITAAIGSGFGVFLILLGILSIVGGNFVGGMWQCLIGLFLRGAAQMSYQQVLVRRALEGEPVARLMQRELRTVPPGLSVEQFVDDFIYQHHHKLYPVVDDGQLKGCVTIRGVKEVPREEWSQRTVGDLVEACGEGNTIDSQTDAIDAMAKMNQDGSSRMMVVDDGQLRGMVTLKDLMNFIALKMELEEGERPTAITPAGAGQETPG